MLGKQDHYGQNGHFQQKREATFRPQEGQPPGSSEFARQHHHRRQRQHEQRDHEGGHREGEEELEPGQFHSKAFHAGRRRRRRRRCVVGDQPRGRQVIVAYSHMSFAVFEACFEAESLSRSIRVSW